MEIISHRGNMSGASPSTENTPAVFLEATQAGFGVELDLRIRDSNWYLSHDPVASGAPSQWLDSSTTSLIDSNPHLSWAINIKELSPPGMLAELAAHSWFHSNCFLFDFELLENDKAGHYQTILSTQFNFPTAQLAARLSDRNEPLKQCLQIGAGIVWADEFDSPWITQDDADAVHGANRKFFFVSPELHGADQESRLKRWNEIKLWGIDGICTDYPLEAKAFFK